MTLLISLLGNCLVWISTTLVFVIASLGNCATYLMNSKGSPNITWTFDVNYVNVAAGSIYGYALIVPLGYYLGAIVSLVRFWFLWGYSLFIFILTSVSICYISIFWTYLFSHFPYSFSLFLFFTLGMPFEPHWLMNYLYASKHVIDDTSLCCLKHFIGRILVFINCLPMVVFFYIQYLMLVFHCLSVQFLLLIPLEFLRWIVILITGAASASFESLNLKNYVQTTDTMIVVVSAFVLPMGLSIFIKMWFFP
ncbi:hypothetical protein SASPL_120783 [Salvia splendens]|uniref:Uncharacterized protein n=1 Tax=Salvia splendens TaxID=180675 RepID=A0A8X8XT42_SALSN|nr:hypothetical protein SASPL_120783 [Salvia splendens]